MNVSPTHRPTSSIKVSNGIKAYSHSRTVIATKLFLVWTLSLICKQPILRWSQCSVASCEHLHRCNILFASVAVTVVVAPCEWTLTEPVPLSNETIAILHYTLLGTDLRNICSAVSLQIFEELSEFPLSSSSPLLGSPSCKIFRNTYQQPERFNLNDNTTSVADLGASLSVQLFSIFM